VNCLEISSLFSQTPNNEPAVSGGDGNGFHSIVLVSNTNI
jgi:hypothetical protein